MNESQRVARLMDELERQGWALRAILGGRARFWCSCRRQHCAWVVLYPADDYTAGLRRRLARQTCFEDEEANP